MVPEYMLGLVGRAGRPAGREDQEGGPEEGSILHLELFSRQARIRRLTSQMDHMEEGRPTVNNSKFRLYDNAAREFCERNKNITYGLLVIIGLLINVFIRCQHTDENRSQITKQLTGPFFRSCFSPLVMFLREGLGGDKSNCFGGFIRRNQGFPLGCYRCGKQS